MKSNAMPRFVTQWIMLATLVLLAGCDLLTSPSGEINDLTCDYRINPLGIDSEKPYLAWSIASEQRGWRQQAYQILVASSEKNLTCDEGDLWDSGRVESSESFAIPYNGSALESAKYYYWKVRVWDQDGRALPWSEPAHWSTGLLSAGEWTANWIGYDVALGDSSFGIKPWGNDMKRRQVYRPLPARYLRHEFAVKGKLRRASAFLTALGNYELYLNGNRVGQDYFMPGWTDYRKRLYYNTYDVTEHLFNGVNAAAAILADGWFSGNIANRGQNIYGDKPRFRCQILLEYEDGSQEWVTSNTGWLAAFGPIQEADHQGGETYDARRQMPGWQQPGFDDQHWAAVDHGADLTPRIESYPGYPVRRIGELAPVDIFEREPGIYIVDMGQNFSGWARIRATGKRGDHITLKFAERLNADSTLHTRSLRSVRAIDTYIMGKTGEAVWEPRFTYHGFQYIEVRGLSEPLKPEDIRGIVVHSDLPVTGKFSCSDSLVNRINNNILWAQKSNFLDIPTDCPQRDERMGWTGDGQVFLRMAMYNMDVSTFYRKWMQDIVDGQFEDGRMPSTAPRIYNRVSVGWGDAAVRCPTELYQAYGDKQLIEAHFEAMHRWIDFLSIKTEDGICKQGSYGDWLNNQAETPIELIATAYHARSTQQMADLAGLLARDSLAAAFRKRADSIKSNFNRHFVDAQGRLTGDTQGAYLLALGFDLLPDSLESLAAQHLVERIYAADTTWSTGLLCTNLMFPVLTEIGRPDLAYTLLQNRRFPSWGYQIDQGATTTWERWDGHTSEDGYHEDITNSFNHYAFGAAGHWLYSGIAGIKPGATGYRTVIIDPQPGGGLDSAQAEYHSISGKISSKWQVRDSIYTLIVEIPANTSAEIYLPAAAVANILESGVPLVERPEIEAAGQYRNRLHLRTGSGKYVFQVALKAGVNFDRH